MFRFLRRLAYDREYFELKNQLTNLQSRIQELEARYHESSAESRVNNTDYMLFLWVVMGVLVFVIRAAARWLVENVVNASQGSVLVQELGKTNLHAAVFTVSLVGSIITIGIGSLFLLWLFQEFDRIHTHHMGNAKERWLLHRPIKWSLYLAAFFVYLTELSPVILAARAWLSSL